MTPLQSAVAASAKERLGKSIACEEAMLVRNGELVLSARFGMADVENGVPLGENQLFRLASMTKPVVAAATMQLAEKRLLSLDDPIEKYIPEFANMRVAELSGGKIAGSHPSGTAPTLRHLLSHSSGIGCGESGMLQAALCSPREGDTLANIVPLYGGTLLDFEPGTSQSYSWGWGFDVLARIVELLSGLSIEAYLRKHVFGPLGMSDTTFFPTESQWPRMVTMYAAEAGGLRRVETGAHTFGSCPLSFCCGGASLAGTASDYMSFARALLAGDSPILSAESVEQMRTPQLAPSIYGGSSETWGLGVRTIVTDKNLIPRGSFGWSGAFGTHFWADPASSVAAVFMSNMTTAGGSGAETARRFEKDVYGK